MSNDVTLSTLASACPDAGRCCELDWLLCPRPTRELEAHEAAFEDVSVIPTTASLARPRPSRDVTTDGDVVRGYIEFEPIADADERGVRTVVVRVNGRTRLTEVLDRSLGEASRVAEGTDPGKAAAHTLVTVGGEPGKRGEIGDRLGTIEATEIVPTVTATMAGTVERAAVSWGSSVETGDLLVVLRAD